MKRILVIGKNGIVATSFRDYMTKYNDYELKLVSSRNHEWEKEDFSKYDAVYNASGLSHSNARKGTENQFYEVNGRLPVEIAEKAKKEGVSLYISMSSSIVYGDMSMLFKRKDITKDTKPSAPTVYGKSKMMAEEGLKQLESDDFQVAIIRSPLIYGERQTDNFPRLVWFAMHMPVFPNIHNQQSMIYIDNICELLRLIIDNNAGGIYYPQENEYICTSKMVKNIADISGNRLHLTKIFNPVLKLLQGKINFIHKALGSATYDKSMSNHFNGDYRVVPYMEGLRRIVKYKKENGRGF